MISYESSTPVKNNGKITVRGDEDSFSRTSLIFHKPLLQKG